MSRVHLSCLLFFLFFEPAYAQTDSTATYQEALRHHEGNGVLQDFATAADLMRIAAEGGYAPAQNHLGRYYFEGLGVTQDLAQSLFWLGSAAKAGDPEHILDYAGVLETDPGRVAEAAALYARAAQAGSDDAAVSLGVLYQDGRGVPRDFQKARELYEPPAARGHPRALNNLGLLYVRGNGVVQDYGRAAQFFEQAAASGLPEAMTNLAVQYENGFGVELDEAKAAELYRAAGAGPKTEVTFLYDQRLPEPGDLAVLRDAAETGDPIARFQLAWVILNDPDSDFAARFDASRDMQFMSEIGHGPSMFNLGLLYMQGTGVPQDYVLGYSWFLRAQSAGIKEAANGLATARGLLTADQLNMAQAHAKSTIGR